MTESTAVDTPRSDVDLFDEDALRAPYEIYRALRDAGPVVHLERHNVWALSRYADVKVALTDWESFSSAHGVAMNDFTNDTLVGTTLASDPPLHDHLRGVIGERLTPRALRPMQPDIQRLADDLVEGVVGRGSFDAVRDLAQVMPLTVVPDLVGWPAEIRPKLLGWAAAGFDTMGPANDRCMHAMAGRREMYEYAVSLAETGGLPEGSLGATVLRAAEAGTIEPAQCPALLLDYLVPALDTTISAIGNAVWLFGRHPDQWQLVRDDPALIPNALNEVLRIESPVRSFTRVATTDVDVDGVRVPAGARVIVLFASANRDERFWDAPETFDVTRADAAAHLAFGYGVHGCAGQGLARLEAHAVLTALARRVERFELGEPVAVVNNAIRALASLPVTAHAG